MPKFTIADGSPSQYALACGHVHRVTRETESGRVIEFRLSFNGASYDIDVYEPGKPRDWQDLPGRGRVLSGWAQFNTLTAARRFFRKLSGSESYGVALAYCLTAQYA